MGLPGKRHPRSLTRHRRSAWAARLTPATLVSCAKCKTPKLPHVVCKVCGSYKGAKVVAVKQKLSRAERRALEKAKVAKQRQQEKESASHEHKETKSDNK